MKNRSLTRRHILPLVLCLSVFSSSAAASASVMIQSVEIRESAPSESGYIPYEDPLEDIPSVWEYTPDAQSEFSDFGSAEFEDGSSDAIEDDTAADFSDSVSFDDGDTPTTEKESEDSSEVNSFEEDTSPTLYTADNLPASYSSVSLGLTPPIRNQGVLGVCWAYSAITDIEITMNLMSLKSKEDPLSIAHLAYCAFHGTSLDTADPIRNETFLDRERVWTQLGGNRLYTIATLSRGYGLTYEKDFPESMLFDANRSDISGSGVSILDPAFPDSTKSLSAYRLHDAYWLASPKGTTGSTRISRINNIKSYIYSHGAVEMSICAPKTAPIYDSTYNCFYTSAENAAKMGLSNNHSVVLVGWDDQKVTQAPQKGAFLIQNSWGQYGSEDGYYWISYEDALMTNPTVYITQPTSEITNGKLMIYQYDGTGYGGVYEALGASESSRTAGANVYTAREDIGLKQISFYIPASQLSYTVRLYRSVKDHPESGTNVYTCQGTGSYGGYKTIDLPYEICIGAGEKFAISLEFNTSKGYLPHETLSYTYGALRKVTTIEPGQSYMKIDGSWHDLTEFGSLDASGGGSQLYNLCIKGIGTQPADPNFIRSAPPAIEKADILSYRDLKLSWTPSDSRAFAYDAVLVTDPADLQHENYLRFQNTAGTSYRFTYLPKGTYYAAVRSHISDEKGHELISEWSKPMAVIIEADMPAQPTVKAIRLIRPNQIRFAVKPSADPVYRYQYVLMKNRNDLNNGKSYMELRSAETLVNFDYIPKRDAYYLAVRAFNKYNGKNVYGPWSKIGSIAVTAVTPGTPDLTSVKSSSGKITAAYSKVSNAYKYEYILCTSKFKEDSYSPSNVYKHTASSAYGNISFSGLAKGTYYLGVRAFTKEGSTKVYGKWGVQKVKVS